MSSFPRTDDDGETDKPVPVRALAAAAVIVGVVALMYLVPMLSAGLSGSDVAFGELRGFSGYERLSLVQTLRSVAAQTSAEHGGWLPLAALQPALWLVFADPVGSKVVQLLLVVANVATIAILSAALVRSSLFGTLVGIGTLLALELRAPHDPVISDTFHYPLVLQLVLFAVGAYAYFCAFGKARWLIISFFLELSACAIDESAWLLALIFPLLAWMHRRRAASGWLLLLAPLLSIGGSVAWHVPMPASLSWLAHDQRSGFIIASKQLLAVLPTSYRAFENVIHDGVPGYFADTRFYAIPAIDTLGWVVAIAIPATVYVATARESAFLPLRRLCGVASFAGLLLASAALYHDPVQWPHGLTLGEAFDSVYFGYFGFGVLFALCARTMCRSSTNASLRMMAPVAFALAAFVICYGNVRINAYVIDAQRTGYETVNLVKAAGRRGLFASVPDEALVTVDGTAPLPTGAGGGFRNLKYLLFGATGRVMRVVDSRELPRRGTNRETWVIRREFRGPLRGGLTVAHVAGIAARQISIDRVLAYRRYPVTQQRDQVIKYLRSAQSGFQIAGVDTPGTELIADLSRKCGPVPLQRAYDPNDARLSYGSGFFKPSMYKRWNFWVTYFLTGDFSADQPWRYGGAVSDLNIESRGCTGEPLRFTAYAFSAAPGIMTITSPGMRRVFRISSSGARLNIALPPTRSRRFVLRFAVDAPAAQEELGMPHFRSDERGPARLVLANPTIAVAKPAPRV